ncbi:glycosyltransferase involved in cell wall biosynthesis/MoaA/NifB/PqqE/SkfB family radical SAM enzyme [Flavobacterium sp. 28A]|uniref:glycosyltransferase n=1 Tax=Flavobacterium sp. 28A TaxID=2735895 RepID=UPI00156DD9B5|nr:glycosyltransferase [Flavobacterium sp. 28A]NRT16969.1 glycosyltransferase involved in cell wall biosynthesis/MoaA/NifB/PqqE/SkfB family radical SAM enzyme [Flavobacterium sp. 28A]
MHILKIIHGYPPNYNAGSEVYSQSICNELAKSNKVTVFTREENPYAKDFTIRKEEINENLVFYYANNPQGKDGYRHSQLDTNFADLIHEINPDIAHIGHLNHLSTGIIDELNKVNIPIIFTLHDFWLMCPRGQFLTRSIEKEDNFQLCSGQEDKKCASDCYEVYFSGKEEERTADTENWTSWIRNRMKETKAIIDKVDLFIAPSNYLRDRFIKDFEIPEDKIIYLDYGFPVEYLTQTEKSKEKTNYTFGYIGTHIPAKGINLLIEAFSRIEATATLKIFGRDSGQSTKALKQLSKLSPNPVEFHGEYINHNLANDVFSNIDCIVVPSIWAENSPLVIHEAQSCKVPVITADFGGMKEYVNHKVNGLLFEHRNANSLQEQMEFAIDNAEMMKVFGNKGYLHTNDGSVPDIAKHCTNLEEIYNSFTSPSNLWRITIDTNPEDCNLKCIMCEEHSPYSDFIPNLFKETGVKRRRMKFETVESIFDQAKKLGVSEIIPSTMGEPLLYKEFDKLFELSSQHNIKINLTTNGTFPKKTVLEWAKLIVPNTTDIKISWNGATKETSEKIMIGFDFEKTISNIQEFIKYRDSYFIETGYFCRVTLQLTFMQNNMHELADIIKLAASLGVDRVKGHQLWAHFDEIKSLSMKASSQSIKQWNQYVKEAFAAQEKYLKPNGEKVILENIIPLQENENQDVPEEYECPFLTKELWISATGKISPCCAPDNLRKELGDFGTIEQFSIEEVLKSDTYTELVSNYKSKPLCKTCNMRKPQ